MTVPSGANAGAGKLNQSTISHESFGQSADHTLTLRSALAASHRWGDLKPRPISASLKKTNKQTNTDSLI